MKKRTIVAIAIAAVLIVAGVGLAAVAFEMGGGARKLFADGSLSFGSNYDRNEDSIGSWPSGEETVIDVDKIVVNWISGSVVIEGADVNEVSFSESTEKALDENSAMVYRIENATLYIDYCREKNVVGIFGDGFDLPSKNLVITVPQNLNTIWVETVSADVEVSMLGANILDLSTTSGEIKAEGVGVASAELSSVSGGIFFSGRANDLDMETTSGELEVSINKVPDDMDLESVSGDVTLNLPADAGFVLDFETVSGDLDCDFAVRMHDGDYIVGNGGAEISVDTTSGDCTVKSKE